MENEKEPNGGEQDQEEQVGMWISGDNFGESLFSSYLVGSRDQTQTLLKGVGDTWDYYEGQKCLYMEDALELADDLIGFVCVTALAILELTL
ncbi:hypothetical protein STEG23_022966 [Scotinomys teguina]